MPDAVVQPGQVFGQLTVQSPGSKMQRVFCRCNDCGNECRVIVYCLVNGKKKRCDRCERDLDTSWKAPERWVNRRVDPRNRAIVEARKARGKASYERRQGDRKELPG